VKDKLLPMVNHTIDGAVLGAEKGESYRSDHFYRQCAECMTEYPWKQKVCTTPHCVDKKGNARKLPTQSQMKVLRPQYAEEIFRARRARLPRYVMKFTTDSISTDSSGREVQSVSKKQKLPTGGVSRSTSTATTVDISFDTDAKRKREILTDEPSTSRVIYKRVVAPVMVNPSSADNIRRVLTEYVYFC
jgi:hypothetical protein